MKTPDELFIQQMNNLGESLSEEDMMAFQAMDVWSSEANTLRHIGTLGRALAHVAIIREKPITDEPFWARVAVTRQRVAQNNILSYGGVEIATAAPVQSGRKLFRTESSFVPVYRVADEALVLCKGFTRYDMRAVRDLISVQGEKLGYDAPFPVPDPDAKIVYRHK